MKEIKETIESLKVSISEVKDENYKELFNNMSNILEGLSEKVEEILVNETVLAENFKYMNDDISGLQEELFEDVSLEELDELDDEYKEVKCTNCGKEVFIETSAIHENKDIPCPYCNKNIM